MTRSRHLIFLGLVFVGSQLSVGCYYGYLNRPVLFPRAYSPACGCGPTCYREFGPDAGCGGSLFPGRFSGGGIPVVSGPVYDSPLGYAPMPAMYGGYAPPAGAGGVPAPGCTNCGGGTGIPIAAHHGGDPIAVSGAPIPGFPVVPTGGVPGVPYDSGLVPTVTPPPSGSVPLKMPSESKKVPLTD